MSSPSFSTTSRTNDLDMEIASNRPKLVARLVARGVVDGLLSFASRKAVWATMWRFAKFILPCLYSHSFILF